MGVESILQFGELVQYQIKRKITFVNRSWCSTQRILPIDRLRLAIQAILQGDSEGFVVWFGILCATWSSVSRGNTFRWYLNPLGLRSRRCVEEGNQMVSRIGLMKVILKHAVCSVLHLSSPQKNIRVSADYTMLGLHTTHSSRLLSNPQGAAY